MVPTVPPLVYPPWCPLYHPGMHLSPRYTPGYTSPRYTPGYTSPVYHPGYTSPVYHPGYT